MTRNEATRMLVRIKDQINFEWTDSQRKMDALNMAIEALDKPLPKPHERLMHWDTARRIIDSPRSKSQMLAVLDSVPPIEALEEVIERKRGKWIDRSDGGRILNPWWESYECSVCGSVSHNWNYCPNCGADMRG